jgi:hypothetical protein
MLKPSKKKPATPRSSKIKTTVQSVPAILIARSKPASINKAVRLPVQKVTLPIKRSGSKQSIVLDMLRGSKGASVASIMTATGWQQHSVRGFLAGVVRKKLKLNLTSVPSEDGRIYKIVERGRIAAGAVASPRSAA